MSRQGGEQWSLYIFLRGIPSQRARCVQAHCHGATTSFRSSTSQAVCASHFPSVVSKPRVRLPIDSLTRWYNFLMHNSSNVQKNNQQWLDVSANLGRLFRSQRGWCLPLRRLLLCFWVIIVQPWFITSYNPGQEVRIMSNCFLQLGAHLNPMVSLVIVQGMRNKLCCNSSHVQFIRWNVLTWHIWQSNAITYIVDSLSSRMTSCTSTIISGVVHVDGQPECLSSSTDSRPPLKHLNHSNVLAWLKTCSPKAFFSIQWVSAAVLLSLKLNLMQILCSLTSAISILADAHENGVKKTTKTRKHVHLQRCQLADWWLKDTARGT